MRNTIKRYKNDLKDWWQKVQDDTKWAEYNLRGNFYTQTCFVTQQIAEKALKTYLLSENIVVEKTHKLPLLLSKAIKLDKSFCNFTKHVKILDRYYITTRYPAGLFGIEDSYTKKEAEEALSLAQEIVAFVEKKIRT